MVNVGNMGSERRLAWTVMGDPVNLASRLEGLNKEYHTGIIISESTWRQVSPHFVCREMDYTRVKGKLQPVSLYELLAFAPEAPRYADLLAQFAGALAAYRRRDWARRLRVSRDCWRAIPTMGLRTSCSSARMNTGTKVRRPIGMACT